MNQKVSFRIPPNILRDIEKISHCKKINRTDVILMLIRTGLRHQSELHKNKASIPEIQAQQALWDSELSRMASIHGVSNRDNEPRSDAEAMGFLEDVLNELTQSRSD